MNDEDGFINQILANPADDAPRLVYADWLEERGDAESVAKAQFLRVECELTMLTGRKVRGRRKELRQQLHALARPLDTGWLSVVSKLVIENCRSAFQFKCPKQWEKLQPTDDRAVRFCEECRQQVHYCDTITEARNHASNSDCIAVDIGIIRRGGDLFGGQFAVLGRPSPEDLRRERELMQPDEVSREREQRKRERQRT